MALWRGRDVQVIISDSSTASVPGDFTTGTDYAGYFETITFKEPERNTGEQKLLGEDASGNSNSETWEEDASTSEISGDLILTPNDDGTPVDIADLFYGTGDSVNYAADPLNPSFFIRFGDATDYVGFIVSGAKLNSLGGCSVDSDGHAKSSGFKITGSANKTYRVKGGSYSTA